jgi:diaminopimelate decarboxylase
MNTKPLPVDAAVITTAASQYATPFHLYDEAGIRHAVQRLNAAFAWAPQFRNYFAVKALPNPAILKMVVAEGCGLDCSSFTELFMAARMGVRDDAIMFTSNNTPIDEYRMALKQGAFINFDDVDHLGWLDAQQVRSPAVISFRYNPGAERGRQHHHWPSSRSQIWCHPRPIIAGLCPGLSAGVTRFGLHTMIASNERNADYFVTTADMLFGVAARCISNWGLSLNTLILVEASAFPITLTTKLSTSNGYLPVSKPPTNATLWPTACNYRE